MRTILSIFGLGEDAAFAKAERLLNAGDLGAATQILNSYLSSTSERQRLRAADLITPYSIRKYDEICTKIQTGKFDEAELLIRDFKRLFPGSTVEDILLSDLAEAHKKEVIASKPKL